MVGLSMSRITQKVVDKFLGEKLPVKKAVRDLT